MKARVACRMAAALALTVASTAGTTSAHATDVVRPRALIFTEAGNPLGLVPGRTDGRRITSFSTGELAFSPNGRRWVMTANSTDGVPTMTLLLSGDTKAVRTVAVTDEPLPGLGLAFDRRPDTLAINNSGRFAFGMTVLGGSAIDRVMIADYDPGTGSYGKVARADEPIPGLELSIPAAAGERYGSQLTLGGVLADGRVGLLAGGTRGNLPSDRDDLLLISGDAVTVVAQTMVTVPRGQAAGRRDALASIERRPSFAPYGGRHALAGKLDRSGQPTVQVVNGRVVLEQGQPFPGLVGLIGFATTRMHGGGHWTAIGVTSADERYLIADGKLRFVSGRAIEGLPTYGLPMHVEGAGMNRHGDLAYAVRTDTGSNYIIVEPSEGERYIAVDFLTPVEVGDSPQWPVVYGGIYGNLPLTLGDRGEMFFVSRARDLFNSTVGDGLFFARVPLPTRP